MERDLQFRSRDDLALYVEAARALGEVPYLRGANLALLDLSGMDLSRCYMWRACLRHAKLQGANLSGSVLFAADLRHADLRQVDLRGADTHLADFTHASLFALKLSPGATVSLDAPPWTIDSEPVPGCAPGARGTYLSQLPPARRPDLKFDSE